jgi:hypothetical protein
MQYLYIHSRKIAYYLKAQKLLTSSPNKWSKKRKRCRIYTRLCGLMEEEGCKDNWKNPDNPSDYQIFRYLARNRLRNVLFSHTSHSYVLASAPGNESHTEVFALWTRHSVYIVIVLNFMNQILGKLNKESCTDNAHPDNRRYTLWDTSGILQLAYQDCPKSTYAIPGSLKKVYTSHKTNSKWSQHVINTKHSCGPTANNLTF